MKNFQIWKSKIYEVFQNLGRMRFEHTSRVYEIYRGVYLNYKEDKGYVVKSLNSLYFRKLFCLIFFIVMFLFRTLLNRNMWMNPLSDVMGDWWIWKTEADGTVTITTECFKNLFLC